MVLEAGLLSGPRGATTPPSGVPGNGKDGRPSLRHEATSDPTPTTPGQADHVGTFGDQEGTEVPPSSPSKAHTTTVLSAQCMDAGLQAEAADGTATGVVQATDELTAEGTPTPREAAKRLSRFIEEVQVMRQPLLISSPPKQKPAPKRTTLPIRSRRIAAQRMDHIPTSKRGEVLLMKKMGIMAPSEPISSAAKRSYDSYFQGTLSEANVETLDALFPASRAMAGGAARSSTLARS